jgi:hypothetical protein
MFGAILAGRMIAGFVESRDPSRCAVPGRRSVWL